MTRLATWARLVPAFHAAVVATVALLLSPSPARAHDNPAVAVPAHGSVITSAPKQITLTFVEALKKSYVTVAVSGPGGDTFQNALPVVDDRVITQAVKPMTLGDYFVVYQVIASDGHPITGRVQFTIAKPGQVVPATAAPTSSAQAGAADDGPAPWWPWGVAAVVGVALAAFVLTRARRRSAST
ncbi:copper resistance CopC family protein [Catellatospora sp. NPDC049111]|uniref:copper resistance CopC family protein n=1 Tax=Catellatospora sp. NPDC049111 TaxID=3155271 RepID=UPI0033DCA78B